MILDTTIDKCPPGQGEHLFLAKAGFRRGRKGKLRSLVSEGVMLTPTVQGRVHACARALVRVYAESGLAGAQPTFPHLDIGRCAAAEKPKATRKQNLSHKRTHACSHVWPGPSAQGGHSTQASAAPASSVDLAARGARIPQTNAPAAAADAKTAAKEIAGPAPRPTRGAPTMRGTVASLCCMREEDLGHFCWRHFFAGSKSTPPSV
mmetsp:Transcript_57896/g.179918  ORF Transcript_57896/g.179918 Transcript_57896/m.179918 type:complete len:206 (-) Transcript_57896:482-1099(-)